MTMPRHAWCPRSEIRRLIESRRGRARRRACSSGPFALEGEVVHGHGIGSQQTVPTLNLATDAEVLPAVGVYVTRTHDLDGATMAVGHQRRLPADVRRRRSCRSRPSCSSRWKARRRAGSASSSCAACATNRKFDSPEQLKAQILRDVGRAQAYFRRVAKWTQQPF